MKQQTCSACVDGVALSPMGLSALRDAGGRRHFGRIIKEEAIPSRPSLWVWTYRTVCGKELRAEVDSGD